MILRFSRRREAHWRRQGVWQRCLEAVHAKVHMVREGSGQEGWSPSLREWAAACLFCRFQFCLCSVPLGFTFPDPVAAFFLSMHALLRVKRH